VAENLAGYYAARRYLREQAVSLVVGLGGYVSAPAARAARSQGVPYILLEQNVVPGRVTRWAARGASRICVAWSETRACLPKGAVDVTGNPIDARIARGPRSTFSPGAAPRLLVLGGSGGSKSLNEQAPRAIYKAGATLSGWEIVHQAGPNNVESTARLYAKLGVTARVRTFLDEMADELANVEIAISRAGGSAVAEFAACGTPAILVPFPRAANDHQLHNAELFATRDACRLVVERHQGPRLDDSLAAEIVALASNRALRRRIGAAARRLARPDAASDVAGIVLSMTGGSRSAEIARAA
jgi:UDP-N-acetylglucosamine--N-acetylmuramyl-(pentapeptide) pyrophosphoryl-undecaprenol N-acetylglucosamine transferase